MLLRRIGNKAKLAKLIIPYFPQHNAYIELFFGAGGMFFNKFPRAKCNFLNDIDDEVYNLFQVMVEDRQKLYDLMEMTPIHQTLWNQWKIEKPSDKYLKAVRFLFLSNMGYMGQPETLILKNGNSKSILLNNILKTDLKDVFFLNSDFRTAFNKISFRHDTDKQNTFIYCDPPYLGTNNNYNMNPDEPSRTAWSQNDFIDLIDVLKNSELKWALSELDNPFVTDTCKDYNIHYICERQTLKSRNTEILITNYDTDVRLF